VYRCGRQLCLSVCVLCALFACLFAVLFEYLLAVWVRAVVIVYINRMAYLVLIQNLHGPLSAVQQVPTSLVRRHIVDCLMVSCRQIHVTRTPFGALFAQLPRFFSIRLIVAQSVLVLFNLSNFCSIRFIFARSVSEHFDAYQSVSFLINPFPFCSIRLNPPSYMNSA
jgi:hypothetical protein